MERYLNAGGSFIRRQYAPHILLTVLFCVMSGFFCEFSQSGCFPGRQGNGNVYSFYGYFAVDPIVYARTESRDLAVGALQSNSSVAVIFDSDFGGGRVAYDGCNSVRLFVEAGRQCVFCRQVVAWFVC